MACAVLAEVAYAEAGKKQQEGKKRLNLVIKKPIWFEGGWMKWVHYDALVEKYD